jgi:hypothetical protein
MTFLLRGYAVTGSRFPCGYRDPSPATGGKPSRPGEPVICVIFATRIFFE